MDESQAVLFANETFYYAFSERDLEAMEELWSRQVTVTCIHPGWGALEGREEVMRSWLAILANPEAPVVICRAARAYVRGDIAYVICFEEIDGNHLIATNAYAREDGRWRMIHHQAGPTGDSPPDDEAEEPGRPN